MYEVGEVVFTRRTVLLHKTKSSGQVFARFTVSHYEYSLIHDSVREAECFVSCVQSIFFLSLLFVSEVEVGGKTQTDTTEREE